MTKAQHEAAMKLQREQLTEMMECGHPVAALNQPRNYDDRQTVMTMYCRSCSIQAQKEKDHERLRVPHRSHRQGRQAPRR